MTPAADSPDATIDPVPVDLRDYVAFDPAVPGDRRVFATDVVAVDLVCLEPGQVVDARSFPTADAIYTVLGGRAWLVTADAEVTLDPLQSVMVPPTVVHGLRNASPDPLILQVVISPPDEAPAAELGPEPDETGDGEALTPGTSTAAPAGSMLQRLRRVLGG